jgi:hypothetical protein
VASCDQIKKLNESLGGLLELQQKMAKAIPAEEITVGVTNGKYLNLGIVNSPWKDLPADEKRAKSRDAAKLAYDSYPQKTELTEVLVTFVTNKNYLVVHYTGTTDHFSFTPKELQ